MKHIDLNDTHHNLNKTNMVTIKGGGDNYACDCGVKGYRPAFVNFIQVTDAMYKKSLKPCPYGTPKAATTRPKFVEITNFTGNNPTLFANLTSGSKHAVVDCPAKEDKKFKDDVWVMGVGEPVRLLSSEYKTIE